MDWQELDPSADGLAQTRLVLHYAIQPVAAVGETLVPLPLAGGTLGDALAFLRAELERRGQPPRGLALPTHPPDFPHHPLADGARFPDGGERGRDELARLFAGTQALLVEVSGDRTPPVWLWPHHFDLAAIVETGKASVGLGVSPGDGAAGRPYWYATLSPPPPRDGLPPLAGGGSWHLEGWTGAELPLERLGRGAASQREQVRAFFLSALSAARL